MQTQVTLNNQIQTYIAALLKNNIFDSADAAVNSILQQQFEKDEAERERFDAALQVGLDEIERGEVSPLNWDEINDMADEMLASKTLYEKTDSAALPPLNY